MAKAQPDRLKIDVSWEQAAAKLLATKPKSAPKRDTKKRTKKTKPTE